MTRKRIALNAVAVTFAAAGLGWTAGNSAFGRAATPSAAHPAGLVPFRSCGDLLGYVKSQAVPLVGAWGFGGLHAPGPLPPGVATPVAGSAKTDAGTARPRASTTPARTSRSRASTSPISVKTNGTTLFAVAGNRLNAVDVTSSRPQLLDSLKLDSGWSHELLLVGDHLLVLSRGGYWLTPLSRRRPRSRCRTIPPRPCSRRSTSRTRRRCGSSDTLTLDGAYVDARLVGSTARIVVSSQVPTTLPFEQPTDSTDAALATARDHNRAVVQSSGLGSWLPSYRIKRAGPAGAGSAAARPVPERRPPAQVLRPRDADRAHRRPGQGPGPVDSIGVMTDARIVYASHGNLYLATERWAERPLPADADEAAAAERHHRHPPLRHLRPDRTRYRGSGQVSGYLLNQWSLSEYAGVLRVVSTDAPAWFGSSDSTDVVADDAAPRPGALNQIGRVGNLGKGERVYAVRFVGPTAYVVTFKQVDPLYTDRRHRPGAAARAR